MEVIDYPIRLLREIEGILILFVILNIVSLAGFIFYLVKIFIAKDFFLDLYGAGYSFIIASSIFSSLLIISCLYFLLRKSKYTPHIAIFSVWITTALATAIYLYIHLFARDKLSYVVFILIIAVGYTLIRGIAWTAYFLKSDHIKRTFIH